MAKKLCRWCRRYSKGDDVFGGHDPCIRDLPCGVAFACCGHGGTRGSQPYVAFQDGLALYGNAAIAAMEMLGGNPPEVTSSHLQSIVLGAH